jgi:cysteine desulfurase / selenocysteine lyase
MPGPTVRHDFPILARTVHGGRPLVYLDNAATSQKPRPVLEAMASYYEQSNANVHRGIHLLAEEATEELESARAVAALFIGARSEHGIVFTKGTTEAINLVAEGWAARRLKPGDEIVVTALEHHSNLLPWQRAAQRSGATLRAWPATKLGELDPDFVLGPRTRLVAFSHVSNAVGTLLPVARLVGAAKEHGAVVVVDAAQSAPHLKLDVQAIGCDFLAFSGHKTLGPTGIGVLWGTAERLAETEPLLLGGGMVREVTVQSATFLDPPRRFEGGTPPIAEAVGLRVALEYLTRIGMDRVLAHDRALVRTALDRLRKIPDLTVYGPDDPEARVGIVSFNLRGVHPHDLAAFLDQRGIAVRAGNHCAQPLMTALGTAGVVRASFALYNTLEEVDVLARALDEARELCP